jgi:hypothetical protein
VRRAAVFWVAWLLGSPLRAEGDGVVPPPAPTAPTEATPPPLPTPTMMPPSSSPPASPPSPVQYPWYPPPYATYPGYPPPYATYPGYPPPAPPAAPPSDSGSLPSPVLPAESSTIEPEPPPYHGPGPSRASWALQLESANGVATGKFQNTLLAGHVDYDFGSRLSLGGYLALANLKGKDRRVTALMPCALVTYEKPPAPGGALSFPLQFATGYLTRNGPVARLAAGLAWAVGKRTDVIVDLGTMAWVTRKEMLLSADVALELRFRSD